MRSMSTFMTLLASLAFAGSAAQDDWPAIMKALRGGGGFENPNGPEYPYFQHVKSLGKSAYPHLIEFIDHEDPAIGCAAVAVLMALTGKETRLPRASTKSVIKQEWLEMVGAKAIPTRELIRRMLSREPESSLRLRIEELTSDDPDLRTRAAARIDACSLQHAALLRRLFETSKDPEVRARLKPILEALPDWEDEQRRMEKDPGLLLKFLERRTPAEEAADPLKEPVERLYGDLKKKAEAKPVKP